MDAEDARIGYKLARDEITYTMNNPFLTEDRATTIRPDNPNRYIRYHFKGFSAEKKMAILEERKKQVEEKMQKLEKEKLQQQQFDQTQSDVRKQLIKYEILQKQRKQEEAVITKEEQLVQQREKEARFGLFIIYYLLFIIYYLLFIIYRY